jgi:hypothetical protein
VRTILGGGVPEGVKGKEGGEWVRTTIHFLRDR